MALSLSSVVVRSTHQTSRDLDGEVVILNLTTESYYGLDDVGAFVWQLLSCPASVGELVDAVSAEFDVEKQRCEVDLLRLLEDLAKEALIDVEDA